MPTPTRQSLSKARWTVRAVGDLSRVPEAVRGKAIAATVPGCIHTDLMDAGLIPDVAVGVNEDAVQWVSWTDWRYGCEFEADAGLFQHHEIDLCFECLDTIATVEINGDEVGKAASEFMPHRFSVLGLVKPGANRLAVTFKSPLRHVEEEAARLGGRPFNGDDQGWAPFNMMRKCASNFRWDWGPRVATCGVAGDVELRAGKTLPPAPSQREGERAWARAVVRDGGLVFEKDGQPIFCRGVNWIPEGLWPRDRTPERVRARLQQVLDANMNMIRVWGGGRYEPDWFYDLCDEMGIMVWQDFMFACACYPEEEPLRSLVEAEARYQITRLSRHQCVVLWCGGNECQWAYESWGFKERLKEGQTWGRGYWEEMLPRIVAEIDPSRPYWPDSPWSGDMGATSPPAAGATRVGSAKGITPPVAPKSGRTGGTQATQIHPNDSDHGDRHTWDVWGDGYRKIVPRYCSEFGQQSPSNWKALKEAGLLPAALPPAPSRREGEVAPAALVNRQRGPGGMKRWYDEPLAELFRPACTFDEWHFQAQLLQARSLRTGIEWMRANQPRCMGALVWQMNDAWPGLSWSLVDSAGREKPAYYAVKEAFRPRLLTIQPFDGRPMLCGVNDTDEAADYRVHVRRMRLDGEVLAEARDVELTVGAMSAARGAETERLVGTTGDPTLEFVVADASGDRAAWFFAPDRELRYARPRLVVVETCEVTENLRKIRVRSDCVARDLWFTGDRVLGECFANMSSPLALLMPGEMVVINVWHAQWEYPGPQVDLEPLLRPPLLWSANFFGAPTT